MHRFVAFVVPGAVGVGSELRSLYRAGITGVFDGLEEVHVSEITSMTLALSEQLAISVV